ncbi:STAS domain-containing protein [Vibrio sp. Isolate25]|uniref:STAS domain-containing protein n=1 Tax=Vibrio TaxID=662 RepID=UPI001EFC4218|nr:MULTISPECIES: STAS domain-containing protein [Vibrio]MCG9595494.1 STAS domain-containing protein [Vibrio sp. Isolate25]MCG9681256.1 STAS domain-containing protein [Vibrio sp. Isolate23]USD34348.1 STAS domain-containing protein [Vibrio sp. SCSIO 43186]USD47419.1 STAS domain-containing protein [Vibrio sp. SCSIO 43145]USD71473.1 STAS domain-containing protein [Vibrio sp. SCSIO 43139]
MHKSISINRMKQALIANIQVDLSKAVLDEFRQELLNMVMNSTSIKGVLIDLSGVKTLDRQDMDSLMQVVSAVEVMGRICLFVGIRPGIAMALVNISYQTESLRCVSSIDDGLAIIGS